MHLMQFYDLAVATVFVVTAAVLIVALIDVWRGCDNNQPSPDPEPTSIWPCAAGAAEARAGGVAAGVPQRRQPALVPGRQPASAGRACAAAQQFRSGTVKPRHERYITLARIAQHRASDDLMFCDGMQRRVHHTLSGGSHVVKVMSVHA